MNALERKLWNSVSILLSLFYFSCFLALVQAGNIHSSSIHSKEEVIIETNHLEESNNQEPVFSDEGNDENKDSKNDDEMRQETITADFSSSLSNKYGCILAKSCGPVKVPRVGIRNLCKTQIVCAWLPK